MSASDPLAPHRHDPNPDPPHEDPTIRFVDPYHNAVPVTPEQLRVLPRTELSNCFIVSTGHGTSGPFRFAGTALIDLIHAHVPGEATWTHAEVRSADGFGTRVAAQEMVTDIGGRPILLAYEVDGRPLDRSQGLVRLIVPTESDDALRQVKWVAEIRLVS